MSATTITPAPAIEQMVLDMMMSFAVSSNVQYRLKEVEGGTLLTLRTAVGLFPDGYRDALTEGFPTITARVQLRAESGREKS